MATTRPYQGQRDALGRDEATTPSGAAPDVLVQEREAALAAELQRFELAIGAEDEDVRQAVENALDDEIAELGPRANRAAGFDISGAVRALGANARSRSIGSCARYVRLALEGGGLDTMGNPVAAADYGPFLLRRGFVAVHGGAFVAGDIAVLAAFTNQHGRHPYGHIQMFDGAQWVSDFKQREFWPGRDYREERPAYVVYRWSGAAPSVMESSVTR